MLDIFFHAESWWKLALKERPRRPCCFLEILSSLSDLAIPWPCVGGCDSCLMVPNGKFQRPNLCQLSLWNVIMQCKFPPTWEGKEVGWRKWWKMNYTMWSPINSLIFFLPSPASIQHLAFQTSSGYIILHFSWPSCLYKNSTTPTGTKSPVCHSHAL